MSRYIIANWKLNPPTPKEAVAVFRQTKKAAQGVKGVEVVVCPPFPYLPLLAKEVAGIKIKLGVQTLSEHEKGAHTGEVAMSMLTPFKPKYAIVGHSERRALGETNEVVAAKVRTVMRAGLTAVLCVGERERKEDGEYYGFVAEELHCVLNEVKRKDLAQLIVAYEPVWAIGKTNDEAMRPDELMEMTLYLRKLVTEAFGRPSATALPILYGGAVKGENAGTLLREGGVQGLLVGSASLEAKEFSTIIRAAGAA